MADTQEIVNRIGSIIITTVIFIVGNTLNILQYCSKTYPSATQIALGIIGVYLTYKFTVKIIKSWINMMLMIIRLFLLCLTIALVIGVYLRGSIFFQQDLPYFGNVMKDSYDNGTPLRDQITNGINRYVFGSFFSNMDSESFTPPTGKTKKDFKKNSKKFMNEYGIEIDESYFDYMNEHFNPDADNEFQEKIGNFAKNVGDMLEDVGIDVGQFIR